MGVVRKDEVTKVYFWNDRLNWGDLLSVTILNHFGIQHTWAKPEDAELVVTGSILEHLPHGWAGTVIGAGKLREHSEIRIRLRNANVLAVRGPLTAKHLKGDVAIGDPGLLASLLVTPRQAAYDLGVIPHFSDYELVDRFPYGHFISPRNGGLWVLNEISKCRRIVSSSLHGCIAADSMNIPRQAELFDGSDFKWRDYSLSIGMKNPEFGKLVLANQNKVERQQKEIQDALASYAS